MTHENGHKDVNPPEPEDEVDEAGDLDEQLLDEYRKWQLASMHPGGIMVDMFDLSCKVDTLIQYTISNGILNEDQLNEMFKLHKLKRMRDIRNEHEVAIRQQQIMAIRSPLFGPDGKPIGM